MRPQGLREQEGKEEPCPVPVPGKGRSGQGEEHGTACRDRTQPGHGAFCPKFPFCSPIC